MSLLRRGKIDAILNAADRIVTRAVRDDDVLRFDIMGYNRRESAKRLAKLPDKELDRLFRVYTARKHIY